MQHIFLRTPYNYDTAAASNESGLNCNIDPETGELTPSLTQQSFKDECDINIIMERFGRGVTPPENFKTPQYGDFTGITDYQSALNAVMEADDEFMSLPANIREQFRNDPQQLLEFVADENNREKAIELGLIKKPPEKTRDMVQAIDELSAKLEPNKKTPSN